MQSENGAKSSEQSYQRGDEVVVNDMPDWQHPFTVSVVYHDGALKVSDKNGAWYRVSDDEVDEVVSPVNDDKQTPQCKKCVRDAVTLLHGRFPFCHEHYRSVIKS